MGEQHGLMVNIPDFCSGGPQLKSHRRQLITLRLDRVLKIPSVGCEVAAFFLNQEDGREESFGEKFKFPCLSRSSGSLPISRFFKT